MAVIKPQRIKIQVDSGAQRMAALEAAATTYAGVDTTDGEVLGRAAVFLMWLREGEMETFGESTESES